MPISAAGFKQREPGRPSYALVASVAVPMAIGSLTQVLTGLLDTAIVGRIGPDELAALALVTPVYQVVVGALVSIRTALHIVLGRRFGANDPEGFARSFATGLIVWTMLAMTVGGLLAAAAPWLISTLFPTTSPSAEGSIHYLQARAVGILPLVLTMGYLSGFVLLGFRWVPMVYPLVLAVLHLPVGWVLAHPVGWGLTGVGVAGIISGVLGLAFMLVLQRWVHVRGFTLRIPARPFSAADARTIVVLGVPEGLMVGLSFLAPRLEDEKTGQGPAGPYPGHP